MSALPERTRAAMEATRPRWPMPEADIVGAAMDSALGPDRLVVAGPFEREIIEKVLVWLQNRADDFVGSDHEEAATIARIADDFAKARGTS